MMIAIPPKYAVSQVVGYIKGKSAIHLARVYRERKRNSVGQHFWARGYDALYTKFTGNGVAITQPLESRDHGMREFEFEDLNGYRLRFGQYC